MANIIRLGGGGGIGSGLNIAYGTTPPTDTTKLWVPLAKKPDNVEISGDSLQNAVDAIQTMVTKFPTVLWLSAAAAVNGKVYIFGGRTNTNYSAASNTIYEYDPVADKITLKSAVLGEKLSGLAAVPFNGKVYLFGGITNGEILRKYIYEYDPATDTLTTKTAALKYSVKGLAAVALNNKVYVFGGSSNSSDSTTRDIIQEYDPVTDTISTKQAVLEAESCDLAAVAINGKAYIFGGYGSPKSIQEYDPVTDTISTKDVTFPVSVYMAAAVAINGKAYIFGGRTTTTTVTPTTTIYEYDPAANTLTTMSAELATASYGHSGVEVNGIAYIFGGRGSGGLLDTIQEYTPKAYLGANHLKVFASVYRSGDHQVVTNIVNGKKEQMKLYMTSAFLGDDDGYAMAQDAYVYDEANSEWQALDGTSMTTDMLAALAELGVT